MPNTVPYEVIAAPYTVWVAPVGTAFPLLGAEPGVGWRKVGSSGDLNYDDATGVVVEHSQTTVPWRALGDCGARKMFRTEEDMKIRLKLVDVTLEQYRLALNDNTVNEEDGQRSLGLSRNFDVATYALLVRTNVSPYQAEGVTQYEIPRAAQTGNPTITKKKGEPEGLDLEWTALVDPNAATEAERFGRLIAEDDTATT